MFVSFISHVLQHCNVFSPWVLSSSLWTLIARWRAWDCSPSPRPSCLSDPHRAGWFEIQAFWREALPKPGRRIPEHQCCCAHQQCQRTARLHPGRSRSRRVPSCSWMLTAARRPLLLCPDSRGPRHKQDQQVRKGERRHFMWKRFALYLKRLYIHQSSTIGIASHDSRSNKREKILSERKNKEVSPSPLAQWERSQIFHIAVKFNSIKDRP